MEFFSRNTRSIPLDNPTKFPFSIFLALFLILQFILIFHVFTVFRYLSIDFGAWWLVSPAHDEWCDPSIGEGLGLHCFGDYSLTATIASESNPWNNSIFGLFNYAAGGLLLFKVLASLEVLLGIQNFGLFTYLILTIVSLVVPALMLGRQFPVNQRLLLAVGSLTSLPGLLVIDRGNSVGIAFAFVFLFIYFFKKGQIRYSIFFLVLSSLVKPHFAIFLLLFLFQRQWKYLFLSISSIVMSQLVSFLAWPNAFPASIEQAFRGIVGYSGNSDLTDLSIPNYSISRGLIGIATWFEIDASNQIQGIVLTILLLIAFAIYLFSNRLSSLTQLVFLGTAASFGVNVSWGYYAVIPILYLFILLRFDSEQRTEPSHLAKVLVAIASALTLSRFIVVIPSSGGWGVIDNTTTIGLMWLIVSISMVILDWYKNKSQKEV